MADGVVRELGDEGGIQTVVGQGDGHVGLAAAEGEFQVIRLDKTLIVVGLEPDHQFAEGDYFCHYFLASSTISRDFLHSSVILSHFPFSIRSAVTM